MSKITLDDEGRVLEVGPGELRRVGLSGWQVRGRDFVRELAWTVGDAAAARIGEFLRGDQCLETLGAQVRTRTGVHLLELTLRRCDDGGLTVWVEPVQYARPTIRPAVIASTESPLSDTEGSRKATSPTGARGCASRQVSTPNQYPVLQPDRPIR
jgi:hypothetical protein